MRNVMTWTALSLLLVLPLGCKSSEKKPKPTDHFAPIASDLGTMQGQLKDGIYQIDSVSKSLDRLAVAEGDLRKPLNDLNSSIADLDNSSGRIRALRKDLQTKEAAFDSSWTKEIKSIESADVRRTAEQGRSAVDASFKDLGQKSDVLGNQYRAWEGKVKSIQSSLQSDLSPENLASLQGKIREASAEAGPLKDGIRKLAGDLDGLTSRMQSSIR
jgi:chromosome segregation ATPase